MRGRMVATACDALTAETTRRESAEQLAIKAGWHVPDEAWQAGYRAHVERFSPGAVIEPDRTRERLESAEALLRHWDAYSDVEAHFARFATTPCPPESPQPPKEAT